MSEQLDALVELLRASDGVDEFVAIEHHGRAAEIHRHVMAAGTAERAGPPRTRRSIDRRHIDVMLYRDVRRGRGSTRMHLAGAMSRRDMSRLVDEATRRAAQNLEPAWSLPPPAAPARVDVADPALPHDVTHLMATAAALDDQVRDVLGHGQTPSLRGLHVDVACDRITVHTSHGFVHTHDQTLAAMNLVLAPGGAVGAGAGAPEPGQVEIARVRARRVADLDIDGALERAARHLADRARAVPTPPGRYDLVLSGSALTPEVTTEMFHGLDTWSQPDALSWPSAHGMPGGAARFGWFGPLVAQADARAVREGLARYLPGQPIYRARPEASPTASQSPAQGSPGDALTVISDGALPFGLLSQPVGDEGEPVRRFTLIESGVAAGLALSLREAALRGVAANGGVRNLYVAPGSTPTDALHQPGALPVLHVVALDWLDIDTRSGELVAALGLGYLRERRAPGTPRQPGPPGQPGTLMPVTGGVIRGNAFELWAGARLAAEHVTAGWYRGPAAVRFGGVRVS